MTRPTHKTFSAGLLGYVMLALDNALEEDSGAESAAVAHLKAEMWEGCACFAKEVGAPRPAYRAMARRYKAQAQGA